MQRLDETLQRLGSIAAVTLTSGAPLSRYTRFAIGGPAAVLAEAATESAFMGALHVVNMLEVPCVVIGSGTNLVVSDRGFDGVVIRFTGRRIERDGTSVRAQAGAELQELVDFAIENGLSGLETLSRIPGSVGAAVYGNAGAYGHSISEFVTAVNYFDGTGARSLGNPGCAFAYRESIFKRRKEWLVLAVTVKLEPADRAELERVAAEIREIRDRKFPVTMRCAGSIFKNLRYEDLPAEAARETPAGIVKGGKAPSAWFLEQVGAKGIARGGIRVADYHANLIYNTGEGTAADLRALIEELKRRVRERFGINLEEEVQYVGFE